MAKSTKKAPKEASNIFHSIMAASVKGNPKPKDKGMEVREVFYLPFENEYDWRTTMFHELKEKYIEAIVSEIEKYKKEDHNFEWKDEDSILNQALEDELPKKIQEKVEKAILKSISGL